MTIRRIGIPATPAGFSDEQAQFFQAIKHNIERLDREAQEMTATLTLVRKASPMLPYDLGVGADVVTLNPVNGLFQRIINNGAFTLQPPTQDAHIRLSVTEGPADGAITTTGFDTVSGSYAGHGAGSVYFATVVVIGGVSWLRWDRAR